ncbi:MAG: homoserine O-acetyltransferase [Bacteroidota bacterium]
MKYFSSNTSFPLESGEKLPALTIAYTAHGQLNEERSNVIWICHALTANADPFEWWEDLIGEGKLFDPVDYYIVCANMLGSCYGSSGAASINPATGKPYRDTFPLITIRDMVKAHQLLADHLGIQTIHLIMGGSMGGQQALEWSIIEPQRFEKVCLLATNASHSPWGIAFNEAQRMAIEADLQHDSESEHAGQKGLQAARAIAMLSYRHYDTFKNTQLDPEANKLENFRASSYQRYQGKKLSDRFDVFSYLTLSKAMDSHNVGRGRKSITNALKQVRAHVLIIGISSDVLFPIEEQQLMAQHIPNAQFEVIDSEYGHDGFLVEYESISKVVEPFLRGKLQTSSTKIVALQRQNGRAAIPGSERF